jgi:AcrR family transcriptional regulator
MQENRKVRMTKKILRDSLVELMREKSIYKISVKDICDRADVSRSTFYTYYKNQFALLEEMEKELDDFFDETVVDFESLTEKQQIAAQISRLLTWVAGTSNFTQVLLSENGDTTYQKNFFSRVANTRESKQTALAGGIQDRKLKEYAIDFITAGSVSLIQQWLKHDQDIPVPVLANLMMELYHIKA